MGIFVLCNDIFFLYTNMDILWGIYNLFIFGKKKKKQYILKKKGGILILTKIYIKIIIYIILYYYKYLVFPNMV